MTLLEKIKSKEPSEKKKKELKIPMNVNLKDIMKNELKKRAEKQVDNLSMKEKIKI